MFIIGEKVRKFVHKLSGVKNEKNVNMKGVVSRTVVRALVLYGFEIMVRRRRQKAELEVAQMKMWGEVEEDDFMQ